jgi:isoquinoline 1-oxidoreductase beta subunit
VVVHPERVQAQFEGAAVIAASLALMGEITSAQGQIRQSNFNVRTSMRYFLSLTFCTHNCF